MRCSSMRMAVPALIAVVVACGGPAAPQAHTTSPPPSPFPGPLPISTVAFSCRLPILVDRGPGQPGAFIDFPSGMVTPDPAAAAGGSITHPRRELVGDFYIHSYDHAFSQWLPVSRRYVSPDGAHYAYTDRAVSDPQNPPTRATLHVVDVKTAVDAAFDDGPWGSPYIILDYAAEGIYLTTAYVGYGLWLMNTATGVITQAADPWDVQGSAGNRVFWVGAVNGRDPHPIAGVAPDELDRLNLVDGSREVWFYRPERAVHYVSQDVSGHPIVIVSAAFDHLELWLVLGPGINRPIVMGDVPTIGSPIADEHGIWFGSPDGIYLYSEANGLEKVSNQPGNPANGCS